VEAQNDNDETASNNTYNADDDSDGIKIKTRPWTFAGILPFVLPSTLLLGVISVLCFFGFAKGTKNTNNNKEPPQATTTKQQQQDDCVGWVHHEEAQLFLLVVAFFICRRQTKGGATIANDDNGGGGGDQWLPT
jgi:hypothetical protein